MVRRKKRKKQGSPLYVRNKKRKGESSARARRTFSVVVLLVFLAAVGFGIKAGFDWMGRKLYSENPRFEIQHLVVSCDGKLTEDRIREYTGLAEGRNLFAVEFGEIEESLMKVPVVESVYLERKLPHTLVVKVKERVPVARIVGRKSRRFPFIVDRYGVVLPPRQSAATLPLIKGVDEDLRLGESVEGQADMENALNIIAICNSVSYLRKSVHIESLDLKYADFIDMRLKNDIRVRMPRFSIKPKLQNLATVIEMAHGQGRRVKEVDLTLDSAKVPVTYY